METVDERISPNACPPAWVRYQHVTRYEWLVDFINGPRRDRGGVWHRLWEPDYDRGRRAARSQFRPLG